MYVVGTLLEENGRTTSSTGDITSNIGCTITATLVVTKSDILED